MEVTGENLANVNTTGYSRQQLTIQAATPLQTTIGQEGTGVEATGISQAHDALLNGQIQAEKQRERFAQRPTTGAARRGNA